MNGRPTCQLAQFSDVPCHGHLVRAHLIPRQVFRRELPSLRAQEAIEDPRSYVMACGGLQGVSGHHGMLDYSRTLRVPREALPPGLEDLAEELGLGWYLDREYGERV